MVLVVFFTCSVNSLPFCFRIQTNVYRMMSSIVILVDDRLLSMVLSSWAQSWSEAAPTNQPINSDFMLDTAFFTLAGSVTSMHDRLFTHPVR